MNFTREQIQGMIDGKVTQFRVLKKEGEEFWLSYETKNSKDISKIVRKNKKSIFKTKYKIGKDYAVCEKGKAVWWNKHHKTIMEKGQRCRCPCDSSVPLRYKITAIKEQKLLDATEEDAKKEGFSVCFTCIVDFYKRNKLKFVPTFNKKNPNPDTWVISME